MKKIILTLCALVLIGAANAQDFKAPLQKTFTAFDTSSFAGKVEQSNKLTLIAKKWNTEWLTHYYAAYSKALISYMEKDENKRDAYLDEADKELEEAVRLLGKSNDETYVVAAMIANARLAVKPMSRWQQYGKVFDENLAKAKELNKDNPRIYFIQGNSLFYKPKMFGGGKKAAMPYYEKAEGLFAKASSDDIAKPYWGKTGNAHLLAQCKGGDDKE